jgi:RNA polymerase sigma-70 factor, ECF subfamily
MAMSESVDVLLPRALAGDRQALTGLLEAHAAELRAMLSAELEPVWQAQVDLDDLLQVTYLEAFLRIRQFASGPDAFRAWLLQIARNNLRDAVKELSRAKRPDPRDRAQRTQADSCRDLLDLLSASVTTPDRRVARAELVGLMKSAIQTLPASYQRVVELFDLQGQPAAEVASALGRSPGAVYMLRARAHDRLREVLGFGSIVSGA